MLAGSMGMLSSASLAGVPQVGVKIFGMYEPIHGSAPRHAGRDRANPIAAILALRMLLAWLGRKEQDDRLVQAAEELEGAVAAVLASRESLTYDLAADGKGVPCSVCGKAIALPLPPRSPTLGSGANWDPPRCDHPQ